MSKRRHLTLKEFLIFMVVILLIGWFFPPPAQSDDVTLSWTVPTGSEACTPDPAPADVAEYRIFQLVATITDPSATSHVIPGLKPGDYTYISTSVRSDGAESRISNETTKTIDSFSVVDTRAYIVAKIPSGFLLLVVGTVPLGTACDPDTEVNGKNAVPVSAVTFTGAQDVIVVAECG